jgi:hypothetical protein
MQWLILGAGILETSPAEWTGFPHGNPAFSCIGLGPLSLNRSSPERLGLWTFGGPGMGRS